MSSSSSFQSSSSLLLHAQPVIDTFLALPLYARILTFVVGVPAIAIALNVASQLCLPRDATLPPMVFYYIPWFGSAAYYGQDPYKFFFECRDKYGDLFSFKMMGRTMTVALGPKGNNLSLGGKVSQVSAEEAYTHLTTPVFGKGVVFDCPNEMLMQQKKFIKGGLSTEALSSYPKMIDTECAQFFSGELKLGSSNPGPKTVEIFKTMSSLIILTAARTLQGKEVRESMDSRFAERMHHLDGGFTPVNFLFPNLPLPSYKRRDKAQKEMSDFYVNIMKKRDEGESEHGGDMIAALQGSVYKDGKELTNRDIAHMMIAILMAGQHTSSATSSWTLLHIAHRPDVAEQLYQEQKKLFGNPDGTFRDVEYEDVKNMPVMDSCIREALRLHAPIHSIYRKVISPITVPPSLAAPSESSSYIIPTSHYMLAAPGVSAMDPRIWPDAETWNPARWTDEKGAGAEASEAYTAGEQVDYGYGMVSKGTESPYQPFGAGRHRCVGELFAYMQLSTIISFIVRNYTMRLETPGREFPKTDYNTMIVSPLNGVMSFTRRKDATA